jgi:hypothetical protein
MVPRGIELATVIAPPPGLIIKIDNMAINLEADDLIVCEHLLEHQRSYSTSPAVASSEVSEWEDIDPPTHNHSHQVKRLTLNSQSVTIYTKLQAGTRVAVMALPGGQQYLVWDKVVEMGV